MTEAVRRDRNRAETDRRIREVARTLLVEQGAQGVSLRAIAREIGITAPALYRYYDSFEDLIQHVCADICADLADELAAGLAAIPEDDTPGRVFAVCRGFRSWAIRHPREFSLVFATPNPQTPVTVTDDPFGRIFLGVAGRVLATRTLVVPADPDVPEALRVDLARFRENLLASLAETGVTVPDDVFSLGTAYTMLRFWVRLYGQVALEVFGRFPFPVTDAEPLFESMVAELAVEVGLA
ncbi:MAG TPA: TetR/AcrR family transcriptional regulator [Pseudonocardiaceae bacterium]|jgi:AcrR family transcriptional regulator|nr:TetR/AcrR family transcriptional regulator [Pseudonocardiaceae bacterium]